MTPHRSALVLLVLLAGLLWSPAPASAEDRAGPVSIDAGQTLDEALRELQRHGLRVIYSSRLVRPDMRVAAPPDAGELSDVLQALLAPHGLVAMTGPSGTWVVAAAGERVSVVGTAHSRDSRLPLPGVRIVVVDTDVVERTADDGTFRISDLERGRHVLEARMPGFVVQRSGAVDVAPGLLAEVHFEMMPAPVAVEEIVVTPSHFALYSSEPESRQFLSRDEVGKLPHLADDLYRAVAWLPGTAQGDISADFQVRGGEAEEILVLLDGLEIYAPFHLKDFNVFSTLDAEAIGGVDFLTGGFPVEYGDRMSGVLDISALQPAERRRTAVGVSFVNAGMLGSGMFDGDRGQWLVSARGGYLELVLDIINEDRLDPVYYDLLSQVRYRLGEKNVLSANVHAAYDRLDFVAEDDESAFNREENGYLWLNLKTLWSPRLYSQTVLSHGRIRRDRRGSDEAFGFFGEVLTDERTFDVSALKQDWGYEIADGRFFKWGLEAQELDAGYDYRSQSVIADPLYIGVAPIVVELRDLEASPSGHAYGAYAAARVRLTDALAAELGGRWDRQTYTGDSGQWSPRANLVYSRQRKGSGHHSSGHRGMLRLAWGLFHQSQGIHELQVPDGVSEFFPAQRAEHRLIGYEHVFPHTGRGAASGLALRVELYQKEMSRLRPRFDTLFEPNEFLIEVQPDRVRVAPQRAEARGIEVLLKQPGRGRMGWWVSYARASVEDRVDGVWVPRNWDQAHAFTFSLSFNREKWSLNLAGVYHSGWPTTAVTVETVEAPDGSPRFLPVTGPRNADRLPAYLRLDFRASRHLTRRQGEWTVFLEVSNGLDRKNVCCIEDHFVVVPEVGEPFIFFNEEYSLPFVPSFGVRWEF